MCSNEHRILLFSASHNSVRNQRSLVLQEKSTYFCSPGISTSNLHFNVHLLNGKKNYIQVKKKAQQCFFFNYYYYDDQSSKHMPNLKFYITKLFKIIQTSCHQYRKMIPSANDILYSEYITVNWYGNQTKKSQGKKL